MLIEMKEEGKEGGKEGGRNGGREGGASWRRVLLRYRQSHPSLP
jgi:hypothetical protein